MAAPAPTPASPTTDLRSKLATVRGVLDELHQDVADRIDGLRAELSRHEAQHATDQQTISDLNAALTKAKSAASGLVAAFEEYKASQAAAAPAASSPSPPPPPAETPPAAPAP